jgi:hypothetical protein
MHASALGGPSLLCSSRPALGLRAVHTSALIQLERVLAAVLAKQRELDDEVTPAHARLSLGRLACGRCAPKLEPRGRHARLCSGLRAVHTSAHMQLERVLAAVLAKQRELDGEVTAACACLNKPPLACSPYMLQP